MMDDQYVPPCLYIGETSMQYWDKEKEVASQLTLLGLVGIETVDQYVSAEIA